MCEAISPTQAKVGGASPLGLYVFSLVQPAPRSMMTVGGVDLEVQRLAADRQSCRPARVHGDTGTPTWRACTRFAAVHAANGVGKAAV